MNYRHAFHAGNFADVFKHVVLATILGHLTRKDAALRFVDTHAGAGLYDLDGEEAARTGEWREGVGRILAAAWPPEVAAVLAPWRDIAAPMVEASPRRYPGSPRLAARLLRPQDRLVLCEAHPPATRALGEAMRGDRRVRILPGDGWAALKAQLPPPERRGLVLIDPPFEDAHEMRAIVAALEDALSRWASGVYAVWYPIKARREVEAFLRKVAALPAAGALRAEIGLYDIERVDRLNGCGMVVLNPPWTLEAALGLAAPALAACLAREGQGRWRVDTLRQA